MSTYFKNLSAGEKPNLLPFQQGILVNNKSIKELLSYLQKTYLKLKIEYILTYRINQDIVEIFFSYIRGIGAQNTRPSALQFKYRLRWYILGKHCRDLIFTNNNTQEDEDDLFVVAGSKEVADKNALLSNDINVMNKVLPDASEANDVQNKEYQEKLFEEMILDDNIFQNNVLGEEFLSAFYATNIDKTNQNENSKNEEDQVNSFIKETMIKESLINIAGYVASRFQKKHLHLGKKNFGMFLFKFTTLGYGFNSRKSLVSFGKIHQGGGIT